MARLTGWRAFVLLAVLLVGIPEARALITAGLLGGIVLGAILIYIRHQAGPRFPRRGTPIVLFPRPVSPPSYLRGTSFRTRPLGLSVTM
jgi:hypothetical protein